MAKVSKVATSAGPPAELYERDYYAWILAQVSALRERRIEDIDWENVAEEIEGLAKSEKRGLRNQIARLYEHLLKLAYARGRRLEQNRRGWQLTVESACRDIDELLEESPSLVPKVNELLPRAYESGRIAALIATNLPEKAIPQQPLWTFDKVMDDDFLPDEPA